MTTPRVATTEHPALVLLYLVGGAIALLAGLGLIYLGALPVHGDTLPIDSMLGVVMAPFGGLSLLSGIALHRHWSSARVWRVVPLGWIVVCGIIAAASAWMLR